MLQIPLNMNEEQQAATPHFQTNISQPEQQNTHSGPESDNLEAIIKKKVAESTARCCSTNSCFIQDIQIQQLLQDKKHYLGMLQSKHEAGSQTANNSTQRSSSYMMNLEHTVQNLEQRLEDMARMNR
jgi:hypothetical protein